MGTRYYFDVKCECGQVDENVYYAPTCGFLTHKCSGCGEVIDLEQYTGITYEEASNIGEIQSICDEIADKYD